MIHDERASIVNLAKAFLLTLDRSAIETKVQTETFRLLLESVVAWGTPQVVQDTGDAAARSVMGRVTAISEAERARGS